MARPNFPPKLQLKGKDKEGDWVIQITGTLVVNQDPVDDRETFPYRDQPTMPDVIASQE